MRYIQKETALRRNIMYNVNTKWLSKQDTIAKDVLESKCHLKRKFLVILGSKGSVLLTEPQNHGSCFYYLMYYLLVVF